MIEIVVEIRGGVLVDAYSHQGARITVIDWDNFERNDLKSCVGKFQCAAIESMPVESSALLERFTVRH